MRHFYAVTVTTKDDNLIRAKTLCGNDPAQADSAVPNDSHCFSRPNLRSDCGVVTSSHDVGKGQ